MSSRARYAAIVAVVLILGACMTRQNITIDLLYDDGAGQDWQACTPRVADGITISRGLAAESGEPEPSKLSLTLDNRSGAYNPNNPASPLFGAAGRNTPLAVAVDGDDRLRCEAADWAPRRTLEPVTADRGDAWTLISGAGVLRRLGRGVKPLRSYLYRTLFTNTLVQPLAYWSMENLASSASVPAATSNTTPLGLAAKSGLAEVSLKPDGDRDFPGSATLPTLNLHGSVYAYVPAYTSNEVAWRHAMRIPDEPDIDSYMPVLRTPDGTVGYWYMRYSKFAGPPAGFYMEGVSNTGSVLTSDPGVVPPPSIWGEPLWVEIDLKQNGANVDWAWRIYTDASVYSSSGTVATATLGQVVYARHTTAVADPNTSFVNATLGHMAFATNVSYGRLGNAGASGNAGEPAGTRIARLCEEEDLTVAIVGDEDDTQPMGAQPAETLLEVLAECARTDAGMLYEPRGQGDLAYRTGRSLYNQDPVLALTYQQVTWPLEPVLGDQAVRNDVTAARRGGSTARVALDAGAMSTAAPPDGVGRYEHRLDVNPPKDEVLPLLASWAVGKGTVDETRYRQVSLDLTDAAFDLVELAGGVDVGDRVTLSGLPSADTPDTVDMLVTRVAEALGSHTRVMTFDTIPARPYEVFQVEAPGNRGRVDSGNTTLHAAIDATQTSVVIEAPTAAGPFWRAGTPPGGSMDIAVGGERMTVTNVGAASGTTQTLTVVRSVNGVAKPHSRFGPGGATVRLWRPGKVAL